MTDFDVLLSDLPGNVLEYGGSNDGKLYQDYPWTPLNALPAHRRNTTERLKFLLGAMQFDITGKNVLDVGCSNGALSIGMALRGARVVGYDWNRTEIRIAQQAAKVMGVSNHTTFTYLNAYLLPLPSKVYDVGLFLSVWKWIVRNYDSPSANSVLFNISNHCRVLLFESGITDSGIDLGIGYTQSDFPSILEDHTRYTNFEMVGLLPKDHQNVNRQLWRCS